MKKKGGGGKENHCTRPFQIDEEVNLLECYTGQEVEGRATDVRSFSARRSIEGRKQQSIVEDFRRNLLVGALTRGYVRNSRSAATTTTSTDRERGEISGHLTYKGKK